MRRKTMAYVLAAHGWDEMRLEATEDHELLWRCKCGTDVTGTFYDHQEAVLKKAGYGDVRFWQGERKSLHGLLDHWEEQGHSTVTIRFLRHHLTLKPKP